MRKVGIIGVLLITASLLMGACAPATTPPITTTEEAEPTEAPAETPEATPTPTPAEFEVISLDIAPPEVETGETVTVTADVKNIGGSEGTHAAILTVDGVDVETKEVTIAPGSSEVITFSLVKDAPGTYEVGIGELSSSLIVIRERLELKHDDGTSDGAWAIGGLGRGHVVHFSPPVTPFTINEVKIYGSLYGTKYEKLLAQIEVWDEDFNILYSCLEPHTKFSLEPSWVRIATPDIIVDGDFYVFVYTSSLKGSGVEIHYDSNVVNEHSGVTEARHIGEWYLETPKEEVNWMIRVAGSQATIPTGTEEEPAAREVELRYDGGPGSSHGTRTSGAGRGYSVHFSPPTIPFTIVEVKVLARLRTGYVHDKAIIEIWDEDFDVLYSGKKPATEFTPEIEWTTIDIPNITVDGNFRVVFFTNGMNVGVGGVGICWDESGNKGSEWEEPGGRIRDWSEHVQKKTNWMIRVVGICIGDVIPVSPPPPEPAETTPEFQEAISSLDNSEKLSQWMTQNLEYDPGRQGWITTGGRFSPERTLTRKDGGSSEFAMFAAAALEYHGYETAILSIVVESDPVKGHTLCVYQSSGSLYTMNIDQIEGPYETYEDIAFAHHKDWSRYSVYYSWDKYQKLGYPDEVVYRE